MIRVVSRPGIDGRRVSQGHFKYLLTLRLGFHCKNCSSVRLWSVAIFQQLSPDRTRYESVPNKNSDEEPCLC